MCRHTPTQPTHALASKTKLLCIYSVGNCSYCPVLAMMCSHLFKSIEPRNCYYSFNGTFSLSISLALSFSVCLCSRLNEKKWLPERERGWYVRERWRLCVCCLCTSRHCLFPLKRAVTMCADTHMHHSTMTRRYNEVQCKAIRTLHVQELIAWKQCFITALTAITTLLRILGRRETGEQHNV